MPADLERISRLHEAFLSHRDALLSYARRRTSTLEDAEEAIAATYLTAWQKVDAMPREPDTRRWLYAVARNMLANERRSRSRLSNLNDRLRRQRENVAVDELDGRLETALSHLRPSEQEVLRLSSWERLTYLEASKILHCSPNAYAIRLHRARLALRIALDDAAAGSRVD